MIKYINYSLLGCVLYFSACTLEAQEASEAGHKGLIFPKGEVIRNTNFTGTAYLQGLMEADSLNPISIGNVTFEPGARSKWHQHPAGQILLVTEGVGYYQEKGQAKQVLRKGDVIKCPHNIPHWHGASADTAFVQVAITSREHGPTIWLDEVTEEQYHSKPQD